MSHRAWNTVNGREHEGILDSGATASLINERLLNKIKGKGEVKIRTPTRRVLDDQNKEIPILGCAEICIETPRG